MDVSSSGVSGSGSSAGAGENERSSKREEEEEWKALARKQSWVVTFSRIVIIVVLVVAATIMLSILRNYIEHDQRADFELDYRANAARLLEAFHKQATRFLEATDALSVSITAEARSTGQTFPMVTVKDFAAKTANFRILAGTAVFNYCPFVTQTQAEAWVEYSTNNWKESFSEAVDQDTLLRTHQDSVLGFADKEILANGESGIPRLNTTGLPFHSEIFGIPGPEFGLHAPTWQISPAFPGSVGVLNFDQLSHPANVGALGAMLKTKKPTILLTGVLKEGTGLEYTRAYFQVGQYRHDIDSFLGDPIASVMYPVFDTLNPFSREVAGVLITSIYWRILFADVLPSSTGSIICVLENSFNQTLSYRVEGEMAVYLGVGDHHDAAFDDLVEIADMNSYLENTRSARTQSYTSAPLNSEFVSYTLRIYRSEDYEQLFKNGDIVIFTWTVIGTFLFTSIVFFLYDLSVARRQRHIMLQAMASSNIVSSLFPAQVRGKLYEENAVQGAAGGGRANPYKLTVAEEVQDKNGDPIADNYENMTVFFANLAGFTKWSSGRLPSEVFFLLETMYGEFDRIAACRKVFKIETIGDCYVAVTGVPQPQKGHAVIMVRFANDCLVRMRNVVNNLADRLGPETQDLELRVGLHSGQVTGGVLRGQKSRFQLFGDT